MVLVIAAVVAYRYYDYVVERNFTLDVYTNCDPTAHSCFNLTDPSLGYGFEDGPYEKVNITAKYAPACLEEHTCSSFSCAGISESKCSITYCSADTLSDGEACTNTM